MAALHTDEVKFVYMQYKNDTNYIAGWLAQNSSKCGYPVRRKFEEKTATEGYLIGVSEFVPMASVISQHQQKISFPQSAKSTFKRAIEARQSVSSHIAGKLSAEHNETHQHFIDVLKHAFEILWPVQPTSKIRKTTGKYTSAEASAAEQCQNRFAHLTVDEPSEVETTGQKHEDRPRPTAPEVSIERSESEIEEEFFFAIFTLVKELQSIREWLKESWKMHDREGEMNDWVTLSLVTNTAIDLVRRVEQSFEEAVQRPARFPALHFPVWTLPALAYSMHHSEFRAESMETMVEYVRPSLTCGAFTGPTCEFYFYSVFVGLKTFLHYTNEKTNWFPDIPLTSFGEGPLPEDLGRTLELATMYQFYLLSHYETDRVHDEISRGMCYAIKTKEIPIWVTFGVQILLDIQKILGESLSKPFSELQRCVDDFTREETPLEEAFAPHVNLDAARKNAEQTYQRLQRHARETYLQDPWPETIQKHSGDFEHVINHSILSHKVKEEFFFFKRQPILCGLTKYLIIVENNNIRLGFEASNKAMFSLLHVYVASRVVIPDQPSWPDMEFVIYQQDTDWIRHGGKPDTVESVEKALLLATGKSASFFTANQRKSLRDRSNVSNTRMLRHPNKGLQDVLLKRLHETGPGGGLQISQASDTLVPALVQALNKLENQQNLLRQMNKPKNVKTDPLPYNGGVSRDPRPLEVLLTMSLWLRADRIDLYFDWRVFQRRCAKIWTEILNTISQDPEWQQRFHMQSGSKDPTTVAVNILWLSLKSERIASRQRRAKGKTTAIVAPLLHTISDVIQRNVHQQMEEEDGRFWTGDECMHRLKHLPNAYWVLGIPGPAHFSAIYKGWSMEDLKRSAVLPFLKKKS